MTKLSIKNLDCERGGRLVFSGINFSLKPGQGLLLTGPNGSGKTSLLRLIAGLLKPKAGEIKLEEANPELTIGQYCHYVGHLDAVKSGFTVLENLQFWAGFLGAGDVGKALDAFDMKALAELPAGFLSAGQKRRLALSRLALTPRPIWLLDEPSASLDKSSTDKLVKLVRGHIKSDGLVIASTHTDLGIKFTRKIDLGKKGAVT